MRNTTIDALSKIGKIVACDFKDIMEYIPY